MAKNVIDEPSEDIVANAKIDSAAKRSPFARVTLFLQQVVTELNKVVTPTRKELISYTGVVLTFVVIMMALVSGLDFVFGIGVGYLFGNGPTGGK
ncbi:MAG: preprotein translocase subunit SecE [Microbacteriaceae bacterium]|nr:preprotein translocase subunit SecE [Microbacteriaceae bacterium]